MVSPKFLDDSQIHARNLKDLAKKDLPYIAYFEGHLDAD